MNKTVLPSKEEARLCIELLEKIRRYIDMEGFELNDEIDPIKAFLEAAERKLPKEASFGPKAKKG